jgi:predicted site-specific integrase-resolvase
MPVTVNGQTYYRTAEVYRMIGISRNTLYRWLQRGVLGEFERRDRRGWRLFTKDEVDILKGETGRVTTISRF